MSLLKKSKIEFEETSEKTPVRFKNKKEKDPNKRKKIKRWVIISIVAILLGAGGYFGIKAYGSIMNIFSDETGLLNLLGGSQGKLLKGEIDGRVNVLLMGVGDEGHAGATLSDTNIIVSYDTNSKAVSMISIPRDLFVNIPGYGETKINAAHAYGEKTEEGGGPALMEKTIEEAFDVPIHYYVRVDFTGLEDIVDSLGGVTVNVENSFCDYMYTRAAYTNPVCFKAGEQHMDGATALKYSRSRKAAGIEGSDFARSRRQQRLLIAIKEKALSTETVFNPARVLSLLESLGKHIKTDLQISELARVYEISKEVDTNKIITKSLDNGPGGLLKSTTSSYAGYILVPLAGDFSEITDLIKNIFDSVAIREENARVRLENGTWNVSAFTNLYDEMEDEGYNLVAAEAADKRTHTITDIIDYANGQKPETIKFLEKKFGVTAQKSTETSTDFDIKIIVASDYR